MTRVTIETSPQWLRARLTAKGYLPDLVRRMRSRHYRYEGYWPIPLVDVQDVAEELTGAGYDVVIEKREVTV